VAQIVVNLLDNAVKYARSAVKYARSADDKRIHVRTTRDDGHAIIEVEDHGPGVPNRQRTKICGFVEIRSGEPGRTIFCVGLAIEL